MKNSSITSLYPYLDTEGILRVGGRLQNSLSLTESEKHQIIIPQSKFAEKLIHYVHIDSVHGGPTIILNILYRTYWIINARVQTKRVIFNCIPCKRQKAKMASQLMAPLPESRCTPARPFLHTAIDFAGPMMMRNRDGRGAPSHKVYIALFKCMATKAIHLELVTKLTADAFIAALHRFTSRRGRVNALFSDRGKNFVAGDKELKMAHEFAEKNHEFQNHLASKRIEWHFNAPAASSQGGYFERSIGVMKTHLKTALGSFTPTWEELLTILLRIEACLNSRPMYQLYDDPENNDVLTPGHFLIHGPLIGLPEKSVLHRKENSLARWKRVQHIVEKVWERWSAEYLPTLQTRSKWREIERKVQVGDIVMLRKQNTPPGQWPLAKIIEVYPGADGLTRVVDLKTSKGRYTRPIHQLCPLIDPDEN